MGGRRRSSIQLDSKPLVPKWVELVVLGEQPGGITWCSFSPLAGRLLATVGRDGVCCVYRTDATGDEEGDRQVRPYSTGGVASGLMRSLRGAPGPGGKAKSEQSGSPVSFFGGSFGGGGGGEDGEQGGAGSPGGWTERGDVRPGSSGGGSVRGGGLLRNPSSSRPGSRGSAVHRTGSRGSNGGRPESRDGGQRRVRIAAVSDGGAALNAAEEKGVSENDRVRVLVMAMQRYEEGAMRAGEEFEPWDELLEETRNALVDREVDSYLQSDEYR